ncbi:ChaN family lipoprotein [Pannonibacter sp. Pt2-lr]
MGEQHDKAAQHRWQLHVAAGLLALRPGIVMGFEMFPARLDPVLARWVAGELSEAEFLEQAEWGTVWGFPAELYLPLFRFCRQFAIPMHGLNCRRALVSEVGKEGWEAIAEENRDGLTPPCPLRQPTGSICFRSPAAARPTAR